MEKIVIIGGGAAGMAAGVFLGGQGHKVHIFEKMKSLGKNCLSQEKADAI